MAMNETRYGLRVDLSVPFDTAVARATDALKTQGFGVLTTIDIAQTLKQKLGRDFRRYVILGACNPVLADRALHAELEIGLLLPCNVIVYERGDDASTVAAMAPLPAMGMIGNPALETVAAEADTRLRAALSHLEASAPPPLLTPGQALAGTARS
jgi:uncharacterized protein (DUF302 family)